MFWFVPSPASLNETGNAPFELSVADALTKCGVWASAAGIASAAATPSRAANAIERRFKSRLGIAASLSLVARPDEADRVLAGPIGAARSVPTIAKPAVYARPNLTTVGNAPPPFPRFHL